MTDTRRTLSVEPEASLRAELLFQLLNAQTDLAAALDSLRRDGADAGLLATAEHQLHALGGLQQQLAQGTLSVAALREAIGASVAASASLVQQGRTQSDAARDGVAMTLQAASVQASQTVRDFSSAYYEDRIFDPYLRFDSVEEERAYREREAARQHAIEAALAEGTPQGNRRALQLSREQLEDAGRHGADQSPEFGAWVERIDQSERAMDGALAARDNQGRAQPVETATVDPLDDIQAAAPVDPTIVNALRNAGVVAADPTVNGHGVHASHPAASTGWERS